MNRTDVIRELQLLPELIKRAEMNYLNALNTIAELRHYLTDTETNLIKSGKVNMKNADTRQADIWSVTKELQQKILKADSDADRLKVEFYYLKHKLENMQLIAKMLLNVVNV